MKFSGEMGEGHRGPRRECFSFFFQELSHSQLFEGKESLKCFTHNMEKIEYQQYKLAGSLMAVSVLHDEPRMSFIHQTLYDMMGI